MNTRKHLLAGLGLGALLVATAMQPAAAADMPLKARPLPPPVPVWSWTGFYIGANAGYSWGRSDSDARFFAPGTGATIIGPTGSTNAHDLDMNGAIAGGQIGYNWQTSNWVFGLETDLQWSGQDGDATFLCAATGGGGACLPGLGGVPGGVTGTSLSIEQKLRWFGTARARLGVTVTPSVLAYVTGGFAYGSVKSEATLTGFAPGIGTTSVSFSDSEIRGGWTVGGGLEAHLGGNWTAKAEYLYVDLGKTTNSVAFATVPAIGADVHSRITDNIARIGLNYKFGPSPVMAAY
jgi:outer membrane immunogenic protein